MSAMTTRELVERHRDLWGLLTRNPLVEAVVDGSLPAEAFGRWLLEARNGFEAVFVSWASLAAVASPTDRLLASEILGYLLSEIAWHERLCRRHGVALEPPRHPVSLAYHNHLRTLALEPFCAAAVGLWAHSRSYTKTWLTDEPAAARYREVIAHWKVTATSRTAGQLDAAVDRAIASASPAARARAEEVFRRALLVKLDLWSMILGGESATVSGGTRTAGRRAPRGRTRGARPRAAAR